MFNPDSMQKKKLSWEYMNIYVESLPGCLPSLCWVLSHIWLAERNGSQAESSLITLYSTYLECVEKFTTTQRLQRKAADKEGQKWEALTQTPMVREICNTEAIK